MLILGVLLLAAAAAVGVTGILSNRGSGHQVAGGFDAFGRTMHGSNGQLFFWGIVLGGVAMLGLLLFLLGLRHAVRRRRLVRHATAQPRHAVADSADDAPSAGSSPDDSGDRGRDRDRDPETGTGPDLRGEEAAVGAGEVGAGSSAQRDSDAKAGHGDES